MDVRPELMLIRHVLTMDEARRIATNIAKLPSFLMTQLLND
jgi:hypothetical protein